MSETINRFELNDENSMAPEALMRRDTINISLNIFRAGIKRYQPDEQELIEWLWGYAHDVLGNSKSELERALGYDWRFIYNVYIGIHDGSLDAFCARIAELKLKAAAKMPLVETIVTKRIREALEYARDYSAMVTIKGQTGRGKTYTVQHWTRQNSGRVRYVRCPSSCTRKTLTLFLCQQCGISGSGMKSGALEQRLFKAFNGRSVIIVDEAGHLIPRNNGVGTAAIELLRDLHDERGCGVVMVFTDVYLKEMKSGALADYFEQFFGRIKFSLEIPDKVLRSEVDSVVRSFCPEASPKLVEYAYSLAQRRDGKLRTLFEDLRRASEWAAKNDKKLALEDLKLAVDWRNSGGIWPEE